MSASRCVNCLGGLLVLLAMTSRSDADDAPDLVVVNGKIVTVDAGFTIAEAMAIRGDRIQAVGTNAAMTALAGPKTRKVDAAGRTIIPGLIDSHVHPVGAATYEFDHPIPEMDTVADVLAHIAARADALEDGQWIVLSQFFITRLRDQRYPTRQEMDAVAPRNPVMFRTGPDCALNSLALKLSGIDRQFEIPAGESGKIERDPQTGEPTGVLRNASRFVKSKSSDRSPSDDEELARLKLLLADYNANGITSIADRAASDKAVQLYQTMKDRDELTCRIFLSYGVNGQAPWEQVQKSIQKAIDHPLHKRDSWLWLRGIKVFLDGGMLTGSAYMQKPWGVSQIYSITDPEYRGLLFIEPDHLQKMARLALENDLQFTAHAVGDGAIETLVDAYEAINATLPVRDRRPCITHCNFMSEKAIERMAALGIVADLQPAWLWLDGATLTRQFGLERLSYFQPYRSLIDAGVTVGGGSDHMQKVGSLRSINPYNPFLGMWIALARQPRNAQQPLHAEQLISRAEALRLYTINNAFLTFEEQLKGSLEPGKLADFVILDTDILECPLDAVKDIRPVATYVGARQVYSAAVPSKN